ncbi:LytTR family DNA-binding domain-containing protein [Ligilactobacillus ceti]|nr:LytTR family DNA-binding domain-containing protein [Ligilactobacillus ceti]
MIINLDIDKKYKETEINIQSYEMTEEIRKIMEFINKDNTGKLTVIKDERILLIKLADVFTVFAEGGKVFVETADDKFEIKLRLYEVEEKLSHLSFIRISKSKIINIDNVKYFESGFTGTIEIVFKNDKKTYVSRRYVKGIKERLGV